MWSQQDINYQALNAQNNLKEQRQFCTVFEVTAIKFCEFGKDRSQIFTVLKGSQATENHQN